ncbi:MAG: prolipoprotein diacylglyceryl transferase [Cytophagales bacterium]|nr:prolipoprotein diacylglyceryl transferase [Cytophagales bacterium]
MYSSFAYLIWDVDPEIIQILGRGIRYYGLFFAIGFLLAQQLSYYTFQQIKIPKKQVDRLSIYVFIGILIGARLGHVVFYDPGYYFSHPAEIIRIDRGGLASHGGLIGVFIGAYLFVRKYKLNPKQVYDRIVPAALLLSCLIRTGNLMNSEIYGNPTQTSKGIVFAYPSLKLLRDHLQASQVLIQRKPTSDSIIVNLKYPQNMPLSQVEKQLRHRISVLSKTSAFLDHFDPAYQLQVQSQQGRLLLHMNPIPRHPTQLYEAIVYFLLLISFLYLMKKNPRLPHGTYTGALLISVFLSRAIIEIWKVPQEEFNPLWGINMGQWLSLPCILLGIKLLYPFLKRPKYT